MVERLAESHHLSPREKEICALMSCGMQGKEIADRLGRSSGTVGVLRARLLRKLNCKSPAELLAVLLAEATKRQDPRVASAGLLPERIMIGAASAGAATRVIFDTFRREMGERYGLSSRQTEILTLLVQGKRSKTVADILGIDYRTVAEQLSRACAKARVPDTEELIALAVDLLLEVARRQ